MNTYKKPNRKGPRYRSGRISALKKSGYIAFCEKFPKYSHLSFDQFKKIIVAFNEAIVEDAVENREGVSLPENLGLIFLGSCPYPKKINVNAKISMNVGFASNHQNWHSDNRLLKIFYTNSADKYGFSNRNLWAFKAVRPFKKKASDAFKKNFSKYLEVLSMIKISDIFKRRKRKNIIRDQEPRIPKGYNEFNL